MAPSSSSTTRMVCTARFSVCASDVRIGGLGIAGGAGGLAGGAGGHTPAAGKLLSHEYPAVRDVELAQARVVSTVSDFVNGDESVQARAALHKPHENQIL